MLFIICLIVSIISIFLAWFLSDRDCEIGSIIAFIVATPSAVATIIMLIVILLSLCNKPNTEARWQERYASLNTRIENHMYIDEDRNELIEAVQEWNEDFAAQENSHNDFWVGIFNPESIDGLGKIDLKKIAG